MTKGTGHDGDSAFDNPSRIEPKRPHQWFVDAGESEFFPNKKQAVQAANTKPRVEVSNSDVPCWENTSSFQTVPNQFIGRLFESESARSVNFAERNVSSVGTDNTRRKGIEDHFREDSSVGLSISHAVGGPEASCFNYGGCRKVKVNQVKDSNGGMHAPKVHSIDSENNNDLSTGPAYTKESQSGYMTMAQGYNKEDDTVMLMGHTYNRGGTHIRSTDSSYCKGEDGAISLSATYSKEDNTIISFVGFPDEHEIISMGQPISSYDSSYNQSSDQTEAASEKQLITSSNAIAIVPSPRAAKSKPESLSKSKLEFKTPKREAPNSFPSNVRSLISTGMLDGVPVKYVSLSREVNSQPFICFFH